MFLDWLKLLATTVCQPHSAGTQGSQSQSGWLRDYIKSEDRASGNGLDTPTSSDFKSQTHDVTLGKSLSGDGGELKIFVAE